MNKRHSYKVISFFLIIIVCGFIAYVMHSKSQNTLSLYILRSNGETFVRDEEPVFTNKDVLSYDAKNNEFIFTSAFKKKVNSGELMPINLREFSKEYYGIYGISPLGAIYPDRFLIKIDNRDVLEGYFEGSPLMSYLPSGPFLSTTEKGIKLNESYKLEPLTIAKNLNNEVAIDNTSDKLNGIDKFNEIRDFFNK